jgi:hypothetical protein
VLVALATACGHEERPPATGSPLETAGSALRFVDVARECGLVAPTWCGRKQKPHLLESGGSGLALFDFDGDGDLDLYLVGGWKLDADKVVERGPSRLYRNRGDGHFEDVSAQAGLLDDGWGTGVAIGDADGDGRPDLFLTRFGKDQLFLNRGDGTFQRVEDSPGIDGWSTGAVFFDADGDGDQDLYVCAYVDCTLEQVLHATPELDWKERKVMKGPFGLEGKQNRYFENLGGGHFVDATAKAGLEDAGAYFSFTVVALDLDHDGDLDLYVANDSNPNYLYRNDGHGHFEEIGLWSGAALDANGAAQAGMGIATGDVDGDGLTDLLVTNFAQDSATLYLNRGRCFFVDDSVRWGLREPSYAPLKWGAVLEDFDLDGDLDLFVANGHIYPQADDPPPTGTSYRQANLLLENTGKRFVDRSRDAGPGLSVVESSRGVAVGDIDGDGDLDLVLSNVDAPPTLLRNESERRGHWLLVDAPGALRVTVEHQGRSWMRDAVSGGSYVSVGDRRLHFGLGALARVERVRVLWPGGTETLLRDVATDRVLHATR